MDRRSFLTALVTAGVGSLSGCTGVLSSSDGSEEGTETGTLTPASEPATPTVDTSLAAQGIPPTICEEEIEEGGILAIDEPAFGPDWDGIDVRDRYTAGGALADDTVVVGIARGGVARAYPIAVLAWHEAVNDDLGGPLLVTYCSLCGSGMVAERRVRGEPTVFGVSGLLWQAPGVYAAASEREGRVFGADETGETDVRNSGNLVLYDEATRSYWSQILARAICGPETGETLTVVPSTLTTWGEWRAEHEDAVVLLPPPHSGTL